ncbi:MAG: glycosyltransferase family 2 protein [Chitinivibrionales bacterium]|nr:glycosyltransferase family 2 protein [Chitinivibrionales bacterium]
MINNKKVVVVIPAYNAEATLRKTYDEIPKSIVDEVILVDDASRDHTVEVAEQLGIKHVIVHKKNLGYGGNQKTCYEKSLSLGSDIIIMLHPDYQYTPKLIEAMASIIAYEVYPVVFASRILGNGALKGGMPLYKYIANRLLTFVQNISLGQKLSEYHTGYRAFSSHVLQKINYKKNSNGFIFDNQIIVQIFEAGFEIGEITCPTRYTAESSSISIARSIKYGLGVLLLSLRSFIKRLIIIF